METMIVGPYRIVVESTERIHIDTSKIPKFRKEQLAKGALLLVKQVFSQPGEEEKFQAWLARRHAAQAAEQENEKGPDGCCDHPTGL